MGLKNLLATCLYMLGFAVASAQVTTSGLNGTIKDDSQGLPGATVKAIHLPSGTIYGTTTQPDGRYTIMPGWKHPLEAVDPAALAAAIHANFLAD